MEKNCTQETSVIDPIRGKIRHFLLDNYLFGYSENEFDNDSSFLDYGVLDSLGILELIKFIEANFNLKIDDAEILPENIDSINNIASFIMRKNANP